MIVKRCSECDAEIPGLNRNRLTCRKSCSQKRIARLRRKLYAEDKERLNDKQRTIK